MDRRVEERDQGEKGGEGKAKYWGMRPTKLYCNIVYKYKYLTINPSIMYNCNAPMQNTENIDFLLKGNFSMWEGSNYCHSYLPSGTALKLKNVKRTSCGPANLSF